MKYFSELRSAFGCHGIYHLSCFFVVHYLLFFVGGHFHKIYRSKIYLITNILIKILGYKLSATSMLTWFVAYTYCPNTIQLVSVVADQAHLVDLISNVLDRFTCFKCRQYIVSHVPSVVIFTSSVDEIEEENNKTIYGNLINCNTSAEVTHYTTHVSNKAHQTIIRCIE